MSNVMLDIETLATSNDALIISIGAVKFTANQVFTEDTIYGELSREDGLKHGRVIDPKTIKEFWEPLGGHPEGNVLLHDALEGLNTFLEGTQCVWACGPHFDIAILQDSYQVVGLEPNWRFWRIRDLRTIRDTVGRHVPRYDEPNHNALDDAIQQAHHLVAIHKEIGEVIR